MTKKRFVSGNQRRGIHPKKLFRTLSGKLVWRTPSDKHHGREYMRYYMRDYRKLRGYLAGRNRLDYNRYMRRKMREYREKKKRPWKFLETNEEN